MNRHTRRQFLSEVGQGMLMVAIGPAGVCDMGLASARAADGPSALHFGKWEPLVSLMQETPAANLLPILVAKLADGTDLRSLIAAGALANARTFGGQDYVGYHALMALAPAYDMARELPPREQALPVLKVLYRNSTRIQEKGGRAAEALRPQPPTPPQEGADGETLRAAVRRADLEFAEEAFAAIPGTPRQRFVQLQSIIDDDIEVHRVVLAWRAWVLLDFTGIEQAHTLLRQSVRFCVDHERLLRGQGRVPEVRAALPKLFDKYGLDKKSVGQRVPDDEELNRLAESIFAGTREQAADAMAGALAAGFAPESLGEALALAGNQLVLRDPGRAQDNGRKLKGSVHGDSIGVHASDAANAWRNIARVCPARQAFASLIVGAFHTGGMARGVSKDAVPTKTQREAVTASDAPTLVRHLESAIRSKDQAAASAIAVRYGELKFPPRPIFDALLRFAVSEDGALHAEKYYRTVAEEFVRGRPAFRWRHVVALARVTASEFGEPAPGLLEARRLLEI